MISSNFYQVIRLSVVADTYPALYQGTPLVAMLSLRRKELPILIRYCQKTFYRLRSMIRKSQLSSTQKGEKVLISLLALKLH
jgi:CRP-like cAMP-binding protein